PPKPNPAPPEGGGVPASRDDEGVASGSGGAAQKSTLPPTRMHAEVTADTLIIKIRHADSRAWLPIFGCLFPFCALPTFLYGWFQGQTAVFYLGLIFILALTAYPAFTTLAGGSTTYS